MTELGAHKTQKNTAHQHARKFTISAAHLDSHAMRLLFFDCAIQVWAGLAQCTGLSVVSGFESLAKLWICDKKNNMV